jgi:hypothetical protein
MLKERLSVMMKLLQERIKENQRCSWKLRRRVKMAYYAIIC